MRGTQLEAWFFRLVVGACLLPASCLVLGCQQRASSAKPADRVATLATEFGAAQPSLWGEKLPGVARYLDYRPEEMKIALTLDACGSPGDGYDRELIDFLIAEHIPATLFINARWIDKNPQVFRALAGNPQFDIENHGLNHLPASVNGRSVYGLKGTASLGQLVEELVPKFRTVH